MINNENDDFSSLDSLDNNTNGHKNLNNLITNDFFGLFKDKSL